MLNPNQVMEEYAQSRYLRECTDQQIYERYMTLLKNIWSTNEDGEVLPTFYENNRQQLLRLLIDVIVEVNTRKLCIISEFSEKALRKEATKNYSPPKIIKPCPICPDNLAKFGKYSHLLHTLEKGTIRIAPGSSYNDPSLNFAQRDNELEHHVRTPNKQLLFKLHGLDQHGNKTEIPSTPKELIELKLTDDFYVWCCAMKYDARLFDDFEADGALIITDADKFQHRLIAAVRGKTGGFAGGKGLTYYDPYTSEKSQITPYFSKNFKYFYQNEFRYVWQSLPGIAMEPFFVEIGSLEDIAFLVRLA